MANMISLDNLWSFVTALAEALKSKFASKQDTLTAGTNITISGSTISAKDTTYSAATTSAAGLMSAADKSKLDGIATGATKVTVDSALNSSSTNPVQNKVIQAALDEKQDTLTFDGTPTTDSENPVTSGGVADAIEAASEAAENFTKSSYETLQSLIDALGEQLPFYTNVTLTDDGYEIPANATTQEMIYTFNTDGVTEGEEAGKITAASGVKWLDGTEPDFTCGSTVVVSVVNNLAVWGEFPA